MAKKPLTDRQKSVIDALNGAKSVAEAAKKLGIGEAAVYGHVKRIKENGHQVTLPSSNDGGSPGPAAMPPMRRPAANARKRGTGAKARATAKRNGKLEGVMGELDAKADEALKAERDALRDAEAERDVLNAKLAEVNGVIDNVQKRIGTLADISALLHDAPIAAG